MESFSLINKVAVVTGSSSGLGLAIASLFARRGACVVLCGRHRERLDAALAQCVQASAGQADRFLSVRGDLNEAGVRQNILDRTVDKFGRLDILVCNAGVALPNMSIRNATEESYDTVMDTNVKSIFFLIQAALSHLEKSKGNIINVSSLGSQVIAKDLQTYLMSKAALDHMTSSLAFDLAPSGVRVNTVNPSFFKSRIMRNITTEEEHVEAFRRLEGAHCPLHSHCVTAEAVAELAAFLASDAAMFITGQNHFIDNGRRFTSAFDTTSAKDS